MKKSLIVYYTRTNTSTIISNFLCETENYDTVQLTDNENWKGIFGFIHAGKKSYKLEKVKYNPLSINFNEYDNIVLISPIWANFMTPTIRSFVEDYKSELTNKVSMIFHAAGSADQKAIEDFKRYFPNAKCLSLVKKKIKTGEYKQLVSNWIKSK